MTEDKQARRRPLPSFGSDRNGISVVFTRIDDGNEFIAVGTKDKCGHVTLREWGVPARKVSLCIVGAIVATSAFWLAVATVVGGG